MPKQRLLVDTVEDTHAWQRHHRRERELDAHGFADDDEVPAILGDMEGEYTAKDHEALMAATRDGSASAREKLVKATQSIVAKAIPEEKTGPIKVLAEEWQVDGDDET